VKIEVRDVMNTFSDSAHKNRGVQIHRGPAVIAGIRVSCRHYFAFLFQSFRVMDFTIVGAVVLLL